MKGDVNYHHPLISDLHCHMIRALVWFAVESVEVRVSLECVLEHFVKVLTEVHDCLVTVHQMLVQRYL